MMELDGHIVEFVDSGTLRLGYVRKREQNKIQVVDQRGRQSSVPASRVVVVHGPADEARFQAMANAIMERVESCSSQIDVELLWDSVRPHGREFSPAELAEVFFGKTSSVAESAIFRELDQSTLFFKRKRAGFEPRSAEQVAAERVRLAREEARRRFRDQVTLLLRQALNGKPEAREDPAWNDIADRLEKWLRSGERDDVGAVLEELTGPSRARETAYDLLLASRRVDASEDRFLLSRGIPRTFSASLLQASEALEPYSDEESRERCDLTSLAIDDEETSEVDDALSVSSDSESTVVGIHIADVSSFVAKDDVLDREAARRSATIYLPNLTVTMFPERLSADLASLVEGERRPTFSVEARFDRDDALIDFRIFRGTIRVTKRMGYGEADRALQAGDTTLTELHRIAERLRTERVDNGAQTHRRPEIKVRVKNDTISVTKVEVNTPARLIVSEMMILANRLAADRAASSEIPIIFRAQVAPGAPSPDTNGLAEPVQFELLRKRFKRSRLTLSPSRHTGLGLTAYTQMSSPIRRYVDLVTQRQFAAALEGRPLPYDREELLGIITRAETAEIELRNLEQASTNYWILKYLAQVADGRTFPAVVLDAKGRVELTDYLIRGKVAEAEDWHLGDEVSVTIETVNPSRGEIHFRART